MSAELSEVEEALPHKRLKLEQPVNKALPENIMKLYKLEALLVIFGMSRNAIDSLQKELLHGHYEADIDMILLYYSRYGLQSAILQLEKFMIKLGSCMPSDSKPEISFSNLPPHLLQVLFQLDSEQFSPDA